MKKPIRTSESAGQLGYLPTIDGLRGIAIILVMWFHGPAIFEAGTDLYRSWFWRVGSGGWMGVDLFFVVSGFLITSILLASRGRPKQLRYFWVRRALRIFPLYYLYLFLILAVSLVDPPFSNIARDWFYYFFYLANIHIAFHNWPVGSLGILWSLTIEEQFYGVWPLLVKFLKPRRLLALCLGVYFITPIIRGLILRKFHLNGVYTFTLCRTDALLIGAALACIYTMPTWRARILKWCKRLWIPAVLAILISMAAPFGIDPYHKKPLFFLLFGFSWICLSFAVILGATLDPGKWINLLLTNRLITFVGKRCYGFYMWHYLTGYVIHHLFPELRFGVAVLLWAGLNTAAATLSWKYFELPFLALKDRFVVSRPAAGAGGND